MENTINVTGCSNCPFRDYDIIDGYCNCMLADYYNKEVFTAKSLEQSGRYRDDIPDNCPLKEHKELTIKIQL